MRIVRGISTIAAVWLLSVTSTQPLAEAKLPVGSATELDPASLLQAALLAGGCTDPQASAGQERRFATISDKTFSKIAGVEERARAAQVHAALHAQWLKEYRADAHSVADTITRGQYNCLTGSLLYIVLARRCGLAARAIESPGHVAVLVTTASGDCLVETTRLPDDIVPACEPTTCDALSRWTRLDDAQLVSRCYYNRAAAALERGEYAQAVALNAQAMQLDPSDLKARENLAAALNNWGVALATAKQTAEARRLLMLGARLAPGQPAFGANLRWVDEVADSDLP